MITLNDFANNIPLVLTASLALLTMLLETIFPHDRKKLSENIIFYFSLIVLALTIFLSFADFSKNVYTFNNFLKTNSYTSLLNSVILCGTLITVLSSKSYLESENINYGEYYSLLYFSITGMMLMIQSNDLIILFIGLELMSICFYVLAGFMRKNLDSNESAIKYFLLGAFITGFFLMGIAFIYGYNGSTNYSSINPVGLSGTFYLLGLSLVFVAFIFKAGAFPLQFWIPDVYQGAPTIVTGMMSSLGKTAAFAAMLSFFRAYDFKSVSLIISLIAIITMLYGNVLALSQLNIKRLLAYSSIAHAGYLMIGFISLTNQAVYAVTFYLIAYILMQLGAFIVVGIIEEKINDTTSRNTLESYKGLGKTNPFSATVMTIFLLSLAGIPPFAGFWGKYYIFMAAIQSNNIWIAVVGVLLSLIGVYYYIKIMLYMWFYEPTDHYIKSKPDFSFAAALVSVMGLFIFGIWPELILKHIRAIIN